MNAQKPIPNLVEALDEYLEIKGKNSAHTRRTYANALRGLFAILKDHGIDPLTAPVSALQEDAVSWYAAYLKDFAAKTERVYLDATADFFRFIESEYCPMNMTRVRWLIKTRARKTGQRLPQFPKDDVDRLLDYAQKMDDLQTDDRMERLRLLRDRALILTLADTGLRIHEACGLVRGSIDANTAKAVVIGKGDKQAVVRFSERSMNAIQDYLHERTLVFDWKSGKPLSSLPIFARHDKGAGKKVRPISTRTGGNIIKEHVIKCLGQEAVGTITPHSLRHWFVTQVLQRTGNLKLAKDLARHSNIAITQLYAHLSDGDLDNGYDEIFNDSEVG